MSCDAKPPAVGPATLPDCDMRLVRHGKERTLKRRNGEPYPTDR